MAKAVSSQKPPKPTLMHPSNHRQSTTVQGGKGDLTMVLPHPHIHQQKFISSKAKRKVIRAGRRGGKTIGASLLAVIAFLQQKRVLYAVPTSDQTDAFWTSVKRMLQPGLDAGIFTKTESPYRISWPGTEGSIRAKTAWNADTLRGDHADLLILDEFQMMNEDAWGVVGAPMLMDRDGDAVFIYTPPSAATATASKARDKRHATKLFQRAANDKTGRWATFNFPSMENPYISKAALEEITKDMTQRAYRQEILAEELDDVPGALWTRELLERQRVETWQLPDMVRIVVGVDPKASSEANSETGIVVMGEGSDHRYYVLADYSTDGTPDAWARRVSAAYTDWQADRVVVETNQGGDMVRSVIESSGLALPITEVWASRGKAVRAEPVMALYERGMVFHAGNFVDLEDTMCTWLPGTKSPDRMDAMVWAAFDLAKGLAPSQLVSFMPASESPSSESPEDRLEDGDNIISDIFPRLSYTFGRFGL